MQRALTHVPPDGPLCDTTAANRLRQDFSGVDSVWLFGYGSLIYKVDFPYIERRPASIQGWSRRLWQGSHDHRGTPAHPGRVVTLVPDVEARCMGMAYRVAPATFKQVDYRERNGYLRVVMPLEFAIGPGAEGVAYIAPPNNAAWLGPASDEVIAGHIAGAAGASGTNTYYVLKLAGALRQLGAEDPHIFAIARRLRELHGVS
ncbi:MAG TPA: gamma-glutamylcyclotransferase [Rhodanobacteraceae bacterium]|nr:gamma-glutamylcyclotransferase [Rhodanobacteraceae bacterium]